jgi:hypothetical protein
MFDAAGGCHTADQMQLKLAPLNWPIITPFPFVCYWPLKKGAANGRLHCGGEDPIKNEFLKLISKLGENKLIHPTQHTQNG